MKAVAPSRYVVFFAIAILGCTIDLGTKSWVFNWLGMPGPGRTYWLWEDFFGLQTSLNEGALFGIGQGQVWLFAALSVVAGLGIVYWLFACGAARDLWLTVALGAISGGIVGNLYDRLGLWPVPGAPATRINAVRDWILFQYHGWVWPNFNIADSLLVCGAGMLVWHAVFQPHPVVNPQPKPARQDT